MERVTLLQQAFLSIATKMADLPIYNKVLTVDVVDFTQYEQFYCGVLISPWCMNLILLPITRNDSEFAEERIGEKCFFSFASGRYEFVLCHQESIGGFYACSLFSPMAEFVDQQVAIDTASAVMSAIHDRSLYEESETQRAKAAQANHHSVVLDEESSLATEQLTAEDAGQSRAEEDERNVSRRAFLTGRFSNKQVTDAS